MQHLKSDFNSIDIVIWGYDMKTLAGYLNKDIPMQYNSGLFAQKPNRKDKAWLQCADINLHC